MTGSESDMETREAATIPARKLVPWTDRKGVRHWVEMEAGAAEELELFDRWARGRRKAFRKTHTLATDADAMRRPRPAS